MWVGRVAGGLGGGDQGGLGEGSGATCGKQCKIYIPGQELGVLLGMGGIIPTSSAVLAGDKSEQVRGKPCC